MHIIPRILAIMSVLALLGGCATAQKSMLPQDAASITGTKLTAVHYEPDLFLPMTNTKGAFALVGWGAAVSEGKRLIQEHQIADPAVGIKTSLVDRVAVSYGMTDVVVKPEPLPYESDPAQVAALVGGEGVILDVRTWGWGTMYYMFSTQYQVIYRAQARLIDARNGRLISADLCTFDEPKTPESPGYNDLMKNGAALLKQKLKVAAQTCTEQFARKLGTPGLADMQ
jgi:hypothetical protein